MIEATKYNLPDIKLLELEGLNVFLWEPDKNYLVLGQRDNPETSINLEKALEDGITILKRPSGGHSVLLSPKTIVIAISITNLDISKTKKFFEACNDSIIDALNSQRIVGIGKKGISDLAHGDFKIMGSSMYRPKNHTFFHAVLNVSESPENIAKYLLHPKTEPGYRMGRTHSDFITSLKELGFAIDNNLLEKEIVNSLKNNIKEFA